MDSEETQTNGQILFTLCVSLRTAPEELLLFVTLFVGWLDELPLFSVRENGGLVSDRLAIEVVSDFGFLFCALADWVAFGVLEEMERVLLVRNGLTTIYTLIKTIYDFGTE